MNEVYKHESIEVYKDGYLHSHGLLLVSRVVEEGIQPLLDEGLIIYDQERDMVTLSESGERANIVRRINTLIPD